MAAARRFSATTARPRLLVAGSRRILEHHVKCKSAPVPLKEWAIDELAKMDDRLREKDAVKDMESMLDDIKEEATQTKLTGSNKNKEAAAKAVCDKRQGRC